MSAVAPTQTARPGRSAMLGEVLRRCETTPCTGLRVSAPGVRTVAAAWLEEAANVGGGLLWRPRHSDDAGDIWLLGCTPGPSRRAMDLLQGMGWTAELLEFPHDLPALQAALADEPDAAACHAPPVAASGLEDRAARLTPEAGHMLGTLWRMGQAGPMLLAQRWMTHPAALPAPPGSDWSGHAASLLAHRLLARAGQGEWPVQRKPNLPLLLDLPWMPPPAALPVPPPLAAGGQSAAASPLARHALVLPLASLPDAAGWQAVAGRLGWELAWSGLTPCLAHLLERVPGGFVFAAAGGDPGPPPAWPASPRLVFCGLENRAVLAQALAGGFALCSRLGE